MSTKTKYEIVSVNSTEITVDVSLLESSEDIFFNATEMARQYGKRPNEWLDSKQASEYIDVILVAENLRYENLVLTRTGGKYQGTWLSNKLALPFSRWLSVKLEYYLDQWIKLKIEEEKRRKVDRLTLKTGHAPLTLAVSHSHEHPMFYHYANEANLINRVVTGMDAKEFKKVHKVDSVRDALCAADLKRMVEVQAYDTILLKLGTPYDERKELLSKFNTKLLAA